MKQLERRQAETMGWPILEPIAAEGVSRAVALSRDVCVAGAREQVNLKLPSKLVSRSHALFVADRDSIYLRDLASRNHTYLNDERIREAVLRNGDVIGLGPLTFRCQSGFDRPYEQDELHVPPAELQLESNGKRFPLTGRTALIGSRGDCDVLLRGDQVDPAHAVIYQREGRRFIRDLRSHSDTLLNDQPVREAELHAGDRIRIGDAHLVYEVVAPQVEAELPLDVELPLNAEEDAETSSADEDQDGQVEPPQDGDEKAVDEFDLGSEKFDLAELIDAPAAASNPPAELAGPAEAESDDIPLATEAQPERELALDAAPDEPELEPAEPLAVKIPVEELEEPIDTQGDASASIPVEMHPAPSQPVSHPAAEEKMTELLGELVETVAKVQSTWEELTGKADEHGVPGAPEMERVPAHLSEEYLSEE